MLSFSTGGSTSNTERFLAKMMRGDLYSSIAPHAQRGVDALRAATPRDSGVTAESWGYEIVNDARGVTIWWTNTNTINGFNVAIGLQYGHVTGTGGWVDGYDFINPSLRAIFDEIAADVWKEVTSA